MRKKGIAVMNVLVGAGVTVLLLAIVLFAAFRVKKHLHHIEIAVLYVFFTAVLSDVVIVISLNNNLWHFATDGLGTYALNLTHRLIILPTMVVLFANELTGRNGLRNRSAAFLKWLALFLCVDYLSVWTDLVEYLRWSFYLSVLEWAFLLLLAFGAVRLYRRLLQREYGHVEEVQP